ncbi:MAG: hypothetical protein MR659_06180 [Mollicutes bacterium]|nr:hypothetical protein [Mollicutes bacterium]
MKKILIFSIPPINKNSNNTFELLFKNLKGQLDLSFLCCRDGKNDSDVFKKIYRLSEKKAYKSIFNSKIDVFEKLGTDNVDDELEIYSNNKHFHNIKRIGRDLLWGLSKWKKSSLYSFLKRENFDYIVAPNESSHYYLNILNYICKKTKAKLILYTWDDNFTFKQRQISPLFFFYRLVTRIKLLTISKKYAYKHLSISKKTKDEADAFFESNSIIIKKSISDVLPCKKKVNNETVRMIYAGNLLNGRDKTLCKLASLLNKCSFSDNIVIDVYTKNVSKNIKRIVQNNHNIRIHDSIDHCHLIREESSSNIGLMLESLSWTKSRISRLSISTKFTDYISAELPILAIMDTNSATSLEIQQNQLGLVAYTKKEIISALHKIINKENLKLYEAGIHRYKQDNLPNKQDSIVNQLFE